MVVLISAFPPSIWNLPQVSNMNCTTTAPPPETCSQGHRSTLILPTAEGGSICLLCLFNLLTNPKSPTVHVSYALSQLSQALSQHQFLHSLLTFHSHFLISPLVAVLSNLDDEPIARQTIDLIQTLCDASTSHCSSNQDVLKEFVARVSDCLSSGSLAWSRRQLYMLHCFGVLLDNQDSNLYTCIRNKDALIFNLVTGLQLSNDEIQGEIMFVLYRSSLLHYAYVDDSETDLLLPYCPKLLHISLNILMKTQTDDVRLNCIAFLTVLAQRGFFQSSCSNHVGSSVSIEAESFLQISEQVDDGPPLEVLFAEAVKGPLLSSDCQVQISTLDLIARYLSSEDVSEKRCQVFIEENIADYVFEILRLSGSKDSIINSSIQVLDQLSKAEQAFRRRQSIGFSTLVSILRYVAEFPFHPAQCQLLKLILNCVLNCPGIVSSSSGEEVSSILAGMFKRHTEGDIGILSETFTLSCCILVAIMKCSSSHGNPGLAESIKDASRSAVSACLGDNNCVNSDQILHSLYLLKEAYAYDQNDNSTNSSNLGLRFCIIDIFKFKILPWFMTVIKDLEEEAIALGVIEAFHSVLLGSSGDAKDLAECLVSSSWYSQLFGCLGLFPTEKMRWSVYLVFSSIVDVLLGEDLGQPIRDSALHLPSDPTDLLFLLGQKSSHNLELFCCQSAVLMILYVSSLYNDRIANDKLVLSSLEQFILLNSRDFFYGASSLVTIELLVNLYGFYRGVAKMSYQIPYSPEAERILFQILAEKPWDSLSGKIHFISLKWLFQQEKICKLLSYQILVFCRSNISKVDFHVLSELITSADNFGAMVFVCLLGDLLENGSQEYDIISVLKACTEITEIAPVASDEFCMHGIDGVLENLYNFLACSSPRLFTDASSLVFTILKFVKSETITNDEAWVGITVKLMDYLILALASDRWTEEVLTIIGIFSLILYHSTMGALTEASKVIVLNVPLISAVNSIISEACSKGHVLLEHDAGTKTGEVLIFLLVLLFFSFRSVEAILPGIIDFQVFVDESSDQQPLSYLSIRCHDLCKLMHFGSAQVKLIASFCLLDQFTAISSKYKSRETFDLKVREGYLTSVSAILQGLIFCGDIRIALTCSRCLSTLMTLNQLNIESEENNWCRVIVEELAMCLSTPTPTGAFMDHHKASANVAAALLRRNKGSPWMNKVFNDSSIPSIIHNVAANNLTAELVILFRELLSCGYLNSAHVADLNRVFQACRSGMYGEKMEDKSSSSRDNNDDMEKVDDVGKARTFLVSLVSSHSYSDSSSRKKQLLEEIELFTKCLMEEDGD